MSKLALALALVVIPVVVLVDSGVARAQTCVGAHCDVLVSRMMIPGEDCGTQTFDSSQTVAYSQLVTGARDFGTFPIGTLYPVHAFDERLDGSFSADDPGFSAVSSPCNDVPSLAPLPGERGLYSDFLTEPPTGGGAPRNLLYWDAIDDDQNGLDASDVDWSPVPNNEFLRLDELGTTATADGGTGEVEGLWISDSSVTGSIHDHIDYELRRTGGGLPSLGVYLAKIDLTMPGFAEGAPIYLLFGTQSIPAGAELAARIQVENDLLFTLCDDEIDNDRDGYVDFSGGDPGCDSADDDSEKSPAYPCDDGIDNDGDALIDARAVDFGAADLFAERDPDCQSPDGPTEVPEPGLTAMLMAGTSLLCLLDRRRARLRGRRA